MHTPPYEAVVILGCNITPTDGGFAPTTYKDHDEFGMLAGQMNVIAATYLWQQRAADTFLFSTGTSAKTRAAYGDDVPTEAQVYSRDFLERIQQLRDENPALSQLDSPHVLLEEKSYNTYTNMTEVLAILKYQGWKNVLLVSARYHIPRIQALHGLILDKLPEQGFDACHITFKDSEGIIMAADPGKYDEEIAAGYASEQAQRRAAIEAQGVRDIQEGRYHIGEFQLKPTA
ncbi:MAG TPA: YdcF family protein [Candidatus Saccharimonadales bacterium]|nr:YdcF family protein [Candidatus Saccharimonadales bacterium]